MDSVANIETPTALNNIRVKTLAAYPLAIAADFPLLRELEFAIFASFGKEFPNFALLIIRVDLVEILAIEEQGIAGEGHCATREGRLHGGRLQHAL
ncbi:hypothetical protein GQ457_09G019280 [Hibiscus cannabinus]